MYRISIKPTTFTVTPQQDGQNKYIEVDKQINKKLALEQHKKLEKAFGKIVVCELENSKVKLPDIVFTANAGLCLPRLEKPVILLPYMKFQQRKDELPFLKDIFNKLKLDTIQFPGSQDAPFEGQAELKWFHGGSLAVCGYGFRATKKSFTILSRLFKRLYGNLAPKLLVIELTSPKYYHLDVAMLEFNERQCIIHKDAISGKSLKKLEDFLGKENVFAIETKDSFCLNAVVDCRNLITHKLTDSSLKPLFEKITGLTVKEVPTTEFEKSGGSVRCMTLDIF